MVGIWVAVFAVEGEGIHIAWVGFALSATEMAAGVDVVAGLALAVVKLMAVIVAVGPNVVQMACWSKICCSYCCLP